MEISWRQEIETARLQLGNVHAQIQLDGLGVAFAEKFEQVREVKNRLILDEIGVRGLDAGEVLRPFDGDIKISQLINKAKPVGFLAGENAPIRIIRPIRT